MTDQQAELWNSIKEFELDDIHASFSFSDRLVRENAWSLEYALRAIFEYKKFMFLICISKTPLTPSDQVDQVWHLHLIYTESYWIDFCQNTLQQPIHHGPTKGVEQRGNFREYYQHTLSFYKKIFQTIPPKDIWNDIDTRFKDINFTRVNRDKYWLVPKKLF
jgi:hypothetical protein